jgi:hypothetical protein
MSKASGLTCHRATGCASGAYTASPNTNFFTTSVSYASGLTCNRATGCRANISTTKPNTSFFTTVMSKGSGKTCYRATACNTANDAINWPSTATIPASNDIVETTSSTLSFITCVKQTCKGIASTFMPADTSIFNYASQSIMSNMGTKTCYKATSCVNSSGPDASYFSTASQASFDNKKTCTVATSCAIGAYSSTPSTAYFSVSSAKFIDSTCYRATGCASDAYTSDDRNTSLFNYASKKASGYTCYRATSCKNASNTGSFVVKQNGVECRYGSSTLCSGDYPYSTKPTPGTGFTVVQNGSCYKVTCASGYMATIGSSPNSTCYTYDTLKCCKTTTTTCCGTGFINTSDFRAGCLSISGSSSGCKPYCCKLQLQ